MLPSNMAVLPDAAATVSIYQRLGTPRRKPSRYVPLLTEKENEMRKIKEMNGLLVFVLFLLLSGCASTLIQMDKEERSRLNNQSDIQAVHYPSSFSVRTPGKAIAGGGGALGAIFSLGLYESAGDKMAKEYALEDPALRVQSRFLSSLEKDLGIKNIRIVQESPSKDSIDDLKRTAGKGMVLDFKTTQWMLFYYPTDWSHYRIAYSARGRLVRLEEPKIIWQGTCEFIGQDPKTSPTMDELVANNGALLKQKINEAADACAEQFWSHFLGR